jgi:hypothetical protein
MNCTESKFDGYPRVGHCINITKQMENGRNVHRVLVKFLQMSADLKYRWLAVLELQDVIVGAEITFVCSTLKTLNQNL